MATISIPNGLQNQAQSQAYNTGIPGFNLLSSQASGAIGNQLAGLPSVDLTRQANAYFGVESGMPGSEFVRNRGFDLYGKQAESQRNTGINNLLNMLKGYSGTVVATPQSLIAQQESAADRASREAMAGSELAFNREKWQSELLPGDLLAGLLGGDELRSSGIAENGGRPWNAMDYSLYTNYYHPGNTPATPWSPW